MIKKNEEGELLLNITAVASEVIPHFTRYNGGLIRRIDSVNEKITTGYSLVGEFVWKGLTWNKPGLYLDCSIGGSRKNQKYQYSLFILGQDGVAKYLDVLEIRWGKGGGWGGDWAVCMWDAVYAALNEIEAGLPHPDRDTSTDLRTRFELEELAVIANEKGFNSALAIILRVLGFYPAAPLYRYTGDSARVTPCSKRGIRRIDQPRVCWDGSCPGYIDRRCSFCGEAVASDLAHLFIPYSEYEALQAERRRC